MHGLQRDGCTATRLRRAVSPFLGRTDARTLAAVPQWAAQCLGTRVMAPLLSRDCSNQRLDANDVHDAGEIVGEDVQGHLARDTRQRLHQEVHRAHARLDRREGVLDRLAPLAHGLRVRVEPPLHGFEHMLVPQRVIRRSLAGVQRLLIAQA